MALQESLSKIQEYNAVLEFPHNGLLGIRAFLKKRSPEAVEKRLADFLELCEQADLALNADESAARRDIHFYAAIRALFAEDTESESFRALLQNLRMHLTSILDNVRRGLETSAPTTKELQGLVDQLENLADRIRHQIPRDAHLASIVGGAYAGPNIAR